MEDIYLRYTSSTNKHFLSKEDYQNEVRPLVMKLRRCGKCERYFTEDNPCVGVRICMACLLSKHPGMKFLEVTAINDDGELTFAFIDEAGKVYTSRENSSDDISEDILHTLTQNGFTNVPRYHTPFKASEPVKLSISKFSLYGDLANQSVIVLDYSDTWEKHHFTFLVYKHGSYKELTKRGAGKVLYEKALSLIEQTKRGSYYYVDGEQSSRIWDHDIYTIIAKMESAMYDLSLQFSPPAPEPIEEVPESLEERTIGELNPEENQDTETSVPSTEQELPKRGKRGRLSLVSPDIAEEKRIEENNAQSVEQPEASDEQDQTTD